MLKTDNSGYQKGIINGREQYIGGLFKGTLSFVPAPSAAQLKAYSAQVYANTPFTPALEKEALGVAGAPFRAGRARPRPSSTCSTSSRKTAPTTRCSATCARATATRRCAFPGARDAQPPCPGREFVLLDNFYVNAEVSADGHNWSMAAYANDYVEKSWPISYGGRGGTYDFEGTRKLPTRATASSGTTASAPAAATAATASLPKTAKPRSRSLEGHICPKAPGFDMDVKDVDRVRIWAQDFDSLLARGGRAAVQHRAPQQRPHQRPAAGQISPISAVADNDLALGQFVEHLSHSRIWNESVVFVLEDDAQNGPDHVDAHRSPAFVISPYTRRGAVDHTLYTTAGVLRTMELILACRP